eukprot:163293-Rhodomonas_salina.1
MNISLALFFCRADGVVGSYLTRMMCHVSVPTLMCLFLDMVSRTSLSFTTREQASYSALKTST